MSHSSVTEADSPNINHLVTEDDTPVDNFPSEKQQRLLVEPLYSSWFPSIPFLVASNVGLFYGIRQPPIVPDVFLSLGVEVADDWWQKKNRSYLIWEFGKPPEVVIEIVSNTGGNELGSKLRDYAHIRVSYYVVFDPVQQLQGPVLQIYELRGTSYIRITNTWLEPVRLGLTLWQGVFEGKQDAWLRWSDQDGKLISTGAERAEQERQRAEQERQRAERLAERLRALGVDPDEVLG